MKLTISTSGDTLKDVGSGGSFISTEGVYDVTLNFVSINTAKSGSQSVNFNVIYNGNEQTIYGPTITNRDGKPNNIGRSLISKIGVIIGMSNEDELTIEKETHKVGAEGKAQEFDVITEFSGQDIKIRVQREYSKYEGEVRRSLSIRNVFRVADNATAHEIEAGVEEFKQMVTELEKFGNTPAYQDGVTPEEAEAYEQSRRSDKSAPSPTVAVTAKKSSMFG